MVIFTNIPLNIGYESNLLTQVITEVIENVAKLVALILLKLKLHYVYFQKQ